MTLNEMRDWALKIADDHGFKHATVGEDFMLMVTEIAEAMEDHRAGKATTESWLENGKPCGIPSELADVIIRVLHFSGRHGVDIEKAVLDKMRFNESRPFMHGGKKL
jgi:NTP pyrophosphatase (non-canonical NTP hydrolase)